MMPQRAIASLLVVLFMTCAARAQVLQQVPDDALLVIKTKDLTATSAKVGKLMKDLGLAQMKPGLDNPLALIQKELGMSNGVNTAGEMAIVFRDPAKTNEKPDKSMLVLIPVSDYAAFVSNFKDAKVEGEVTEVSMPKGNEPGFIAQWGNYAALSPSKTVAGMKAGTPLKIGGDATNKELAGKDIVFYANMKALRTNLIPQLQGVRDKAMEEMEATNDANLAKFRPLIKSAAGQVFLAFESFLRDTDAATISVDFGPEGMKVALMSEFIPDSYLGSTFAAVKNTSEPVLAGLPTGKYLFFGGYVNQPEVSTKLLNDFIGPIMKELDTMGPEMKAAHDYVDAINTALKATKSASFGVVAPSGQLGQEAIFQLMTVSKGDAAALKASQVKMVKAQEETMKALGMPADAYSSTVNPAAKTVDGVTFDSIVTTMNPNSKDPAAMQQANVMALLYGPGGVNMLQGEVNKDTFMMAMGVPDAVLQGAIAAAKTGEAPLVASPGVKAVASHLPTNRTGELYVPLDQIITTGLTYAKQFGAPLNVTIQPDLPPLGFATSTDGSALRIDGYIPTVLVQQLVSAGMQAWMQTQGGGGGGL
ncbi:MAG: hypothetical protein H7Z14_09045 [Anaerolineae bacterium]|nr:hypothetical protein [Phycisphaerae bacterium]